MIFWSKVVHLAFILEKDVSAFLELLRDRQEMLGEPRDIEHIGKSQDLTTLESEIYSAFPNGRQRSLVRSV